MSTLPETMDADEGLTWAWLYLESEKGPWLEIGRTVGRNIALNGARQIASALAGLAVKRDKDGRNPGKQLKDQGWEVTFAIARDMAEGRDLADMKPPIRHRRDDKNAFARGVMIGLSNPNRRPT